MNWRAAWLHSKFEESLGYIVTPYLSKHQQQNQKSKQGERELICVVGKEAPCGSFSALPSLPSLPLPRGRCFVFQCLVTFWLFLVLCDYLVVIIFLFEGQPSILKDPSAMWLLVFGVGKQTMNPEVWAQSLVTKERVNVGVQRIVGGEWALQRSNRAHSYFSNRIWTDSRWFLGETGEIIHGPFQM